ncbi:conserved hypothetical protein [Talaromyces stipitatus ATCC 10500]|uniref:Cyanovirin-N domain-containing protein n=1 Tax=Talaromyces stipitatus (strain ATCC 10500 / CBS 375.48 / QM 6759 / NRRL 1006) TaxID=441959 RepID=B8MJ20_TALSN|nr:uncharacterized protein TSTA_051200 [Talaromyces stipitatus ATCC 10500]EED15682.1 conserved hypothetical protein [Talaromyces stipitatus ATCC 10500]
MEVYINQIQSSSGAYEESCTQCELLDGAATLQCYCTGTFANESGNSTLNLEEYIANYDGHLLSSLEGTPSVPSDSSLAVPSNVVLSLNAFVGTGTSCPSNEGAYLNFVGPEPCWGLYVSPEPVVWSSFRATSNPGWSISVYNVSTCTGTPIVTFDQDSVNDCIAVGQDGGIYLSIMPLWNWD